MGFLVLLLLLASPVAAAEGEAPKESVCISCHRDMGGESGPVGLWEKSIHKQMGNNCEGCHGGDPNDPADAMNPAKGFVGAPKGQQIPDFCGKCHVGVVENYKKSPHYAAFLEGRGPSCITCHQSHDVQRASFDLINEELCSTCHSYDNGRKMKQAFVSAEIALQEMREELHSLDRRGMPVKKLEEKLFAERNSLHQMTHTLDVGEIEGKTKAALVGLETMANEAKVFKQRIRRRWWVGLGVGGFLVVLIFVLIKLLETFEAEE